MKAFWDQVEKTPTCWVWRGDKQRNGYGRLAKHKAHRLSYELHFGEIPKGMVIRHSCDNKLCVNPEHLKLGTYSQNLKEAYERGLRSEKGPHRPEVRLTPEEIRLIQTSSERPWSLAQQFNISPQRVRTIQSRQGPIRMQALDIEAIRADQGSIKELAKKYHISKKRVADIRDGCYEKRAPLTPDQVEHILLLSTQFKFNGHPNYLRISKETGINRKTVKKVLLSRAPSL